MCYWKAVSDFAYGVDGLVKSINHYRDRVLYGFGFSGLSDPLGAGVSGPV